MKWNIKEYAAGALCLAAVAGCSMVPSLRSGASTGSSASMAMVTARDQWGVPFISAPDEAAAAYALAFAMAQDGFAEIDEVYATALGRSAEYHGEAAVSSDMLRLQLGNAERARTEFAQLPDSAAAIWRGFADGLTAFMLQNPAQRPHHFARFEPWIVYAYARDVVVIQPVAHALADRSGRSRGTDEIADEDMFAASAGTTVGASGTERVALFVAASTLERPYESDVRIGGRPRVHGFSELGVPVVREGFTDSVAFAAWPSPRDSVLERIVITAGTAGVANRSDSMRVNTANGVVVRMIEISNIGGRPVVWREGDTAWVARGADLNAAAVFAQWRAIAHAGSAADAAGVVGPQILHWMHASGATNGMRAASRPAIREDVAAAAMDSITSWKLESVAAVAFDTRVATAENAIAGLVDEWEQVGARNPERAAPLDSAVAMLRAWDQRSDAASPAMSLYALWFDHHAALAGDGALTGFRALELATRDRQTYPPRPWSQVNRVVRAGDERAGHPTAGAPARYGILFAYERRRSPRAVWAVDFVSRSAKSVVSYGQSWDPSSPHWTDQAPLFAAGALKQIVVPETRAQMLP